MQELADAVSAMKLVKDAEKKRVDGQHINERSTQDKEGARPREEPGQKSKPTLQVLDLDRLQKLDLPEEEN